VKDPTHSSDSRIMLKAEGSFTRLGGQGLRLQDDTIKTAGRPSG